ncbi:hypothetical protein [Arthrobacter sp. AFG20]|uniref:hypothetical protein n=1 Tax=Arthrobacter sp. AFG20 TaxID=1688671 RepID=UPI000C9EC423|nr:hypothetical protein [Arthrobacter sp. AFG20]PNH78919.1 hypothetical protein CXZ05_21060 [Arthrobacter sp. AFG20]
MQSLEDVAREWSPEPQVMTRSITGQPVEAFAALLDEQRPALLSGQAIPPLWHWFYFADLRRQDELGDDGHPREGAFLPPIPGRKRMFAGGRLEQFSPFLVGGEYTRRSRLAKTALKQARSGQLLFATIRHEYEAGGELVAAEEEDIVYRQQLAAPSRKEPQSEEKRPVEHADGGFTRTTRVDETFLFRFSALTYNAHRIHYDRTYTTEIEGYPDLVVHGPLLALLALEIPRKVEGGDSLLRSIDFRLTKPAFLGASVEARGQRDGNVWKVEAGNSGEAPSVTATATYTEGQNQ